LGTVSANDHPPGDLLYNFRQGLAYLAAYSHGCGRQLLYRRQLLGSVSVSTGRLDCPGLPEHGQRLGGSRGGNHARSECLLDAAERLAYCQSGWYIPGQRLRQIRKRLRDLGLGRPAYCCRLSKYGECLCGSRGGNYTRSKSLLDTAERLAYR
jgi:hypothetical protein